jgi:hypothetical protein
MNSIAQTTAALLGLLDEHCPREHFPDAMFAAYQPDDFTSPMEEGVSLYLFQVNVSPDASPGLAICYLLTAWSPDPLRQQQILGWALGVFGKHPVLPQCQVEILPLNIADLAAVWSMARTGAQPSVALLVRC